MGQLSRALRVAIAMPLRGTLDSGSSGACFQLGSGGSEYLDVVEQLRKDLAGLVDEPGAVRALALEQAHDSGLDSRAWYALRPGPHRVRPARSRPSGSVGRSSVQLGR